MQDLTARLLVPQPDVLEGSFLKDPVLYKQCLVSVQKLRGSVYLSDGAIQSSQLFEDGFILPQDDKAWHFVLVHQKSVVACLRFLLYSNTVPFQDLVVSNSAIANHPHWSSKFKESVEAEISKAKEQGIWFAELGGWAIAKEFRCTKVALQTLVASYAWGELIGGGLSCCTATNRHNSSGILRKIGGRSFYHGNEEIPPYFDPHFNCEMEVLRFDSRMVKPKFKSLVTEMRKRIKVGLITR